MKTTLKKASLKLLNCIIDDPQTFIATIVIPMSITHIKLTIDPTSKLA